MLDDVYRATEDQCIPMPIADALVEFDPIHPDDPGLIDRILDLKFGKRMVRWDAIARRLNEQEEPDAQIPPEVVRECMHSPAFQRAWDLARHDPYGWNQKRFRAVERITRLRMENDEMASKANEDKRTRVACVHFGLGTAGFTPQTQVAVGPSEEMKGFVAEMFRKRQVESDAPR